MNIIVSCKIVPDDQDIQVAPDRTLDYSKAKGVVSAYDLNAIEAAAQLAAGQDVLHARDAGHGHVGRHRHHSRKWHAHRLHHVL